MRIKLALVFAAAISAALTLTAQAQTTYYVNGSCGSDAWTGTNSVCVAPDGPKRTIQAGIDTSATGDTVIVADGTYTGTGNRDLDFGGRDIHLRSASLDPNLCIIDCQGTANDPHRGFYFHSRETNAALVEGFTIRNGHVTSASPGGPNGGGILFLRDARATIRDCAFGANRADMHGGGMYLENITVTDCTFIGNSAGNDGGGTYNERPNNLTFTNCTFLDNSAGDRGGGMFSPSGDESLSNCYFAGNTAVIGGGMYEGGGGCNPGATLTDCTFNENSAVIGGGMYTTDTCGTGATLINCTFSGNSADLGGGIVNSGSGNDVRFTNCRFTGNSATFGGGMGNLESRPRLTNCTFADNLADDGAGIYNINTSPIVTNCILWDNSIDQIFGNASVTYSCIEGGWAGTGNITADPLFVDPANGDYHISVGSPVIDAGDNTAVPAGVTTDLDGNPRFVDDPNAPNTGVPGNGFAEIVDMGAYEFQGEVCYADCDQSGALDIFDFLCFQNSFVSGEPYACDCDPDPACNIFDFLCFQTAFVGGCP